MDSRYWAFSHKIVDSNILDTGHVYINLPQIPTYSASSIAPAGHVKCCLSISVSHHRHHIKQGGE